MTWALLIDVDSIRKMDNIAIGKLLTHYNSKNYDVKVIKLNYPAYPHNKKKTIIDASKYDVVRASIIFKRNKNMVEIKNCDDVMFGGTGYDLTTKLPKEIDDLEYTSYCNDDERVEFITRGCNNNCWFCVVNQKEGPLYQYRSIERILDHYNGRPIRFLDNNFLMWEGSQKTLKILADKKIKCYFDQGLDIRLINDENAKLLSLLTYGSPEYVFGFDNVNIIPLANKKLALMKKYIVKGWKFKFYIFTSASEPIRDVIIRVNWCKKNQVLPYIMRHEDCYVSHLKNFYTDLAAWCNQPGIFKKMTFEDYIFKRHPENHERAKLSLNTLKLSGVVVWPGTYL